MNIANCEEDVKVADREHYLDVADLEHYVSVSDRKDRENADRDTNIRLRGQCIFYFS